MVTDGGVCNGSRGMCARQHVRHKESVNEKEKDGARKIEKEAYVVRETEDGVGFFVSMAMTQF
ncbi:hypothetical protein L195_g008845 [Trifolium pratense]|uniref:Uncharacterized protein n=1 Tax=Trifolium pratense TaxID=57577 RepID=A0A2K3PAB2_TRIPR|nr:hypothetical protein L195_g008845 [Trifolium pratense]